MRTVRAIFVFPILLALSLSARASDGHDASLSSLPVGAQSSISAALGRDIRDYRVQVQDAGFHAENAQHKLAADFTAEGVEVRSGTVHWRMTLHGYGYGNAIKAIETVAPQASSNRVEYRHGSLTEWYVNGPVGLEQGFTIKAPPTKSNGKPLTLALTLSGDLTTAVDQDRRGLSLTAHDGRASLRYGGLTVRDATGKTLPAWMEVRGEQLLLQTDDRMASYPLVIDPWVQLAKLTASDGATNDFFGAVSISGDTVVVGARNATVGSNVSQGATYVFVKPASGWGNMAQTAKLTASDGAYADLLGWSVSISGDTVIAGAPFATIGSDQRKGAVYVFVKPANGWTNENEVAKLTHTYLQFDQYFGSAVAISGDTAVISGDSSLSVFVRPAGGWASETETADLNLNTGGLPASVSISGDTVVAGALLTDVGHHISQGSARVFVRPPGGWRHMAKTADLTASDGRSGDLFGDAVAISVNTIVVGSINNPATRNNIGPGAAYVFVKPAAGWKTMTETAKLTAGDTKRGIRFGGAVAVSGKKVVIGEQPFDPPKKPDVVYVYTEPAGGWKTTSKFDAELTASDGTKKDYFGSSVAISGKTIAAGAPGATVNGHGYQGTAYVFGR